MLLLCVSWCTLILAQITQVALHDAALQDMEFVCWDSGCFTLYWDKRRFKKSRGQCETREGDLVTVKNKVQADVIAMVMAKAHTDDARVWIGLELKYNQCTDLQKPLRGFTWVTGDSLNDYSNWKKDEQKCGALCVTVHKDGTWEETSCDYKADGYLCEKSYTSTCSYLPLPSSYNVTYYHQALGVSHTGGAVFPPDTIAVISTFSGITKLLCEEKSDGTGAWSREIPGAWNCEIENGGCEHECIDVTGIAECRCPSGSELKADRRGCTKPCDPNPCSQHCDLHSDPPGFKCRCSMGYILGSDGKSCEDIDECAVNANNCSQICNNTIGSYVCMCNPGYEKVHDNCEDIDECHSVMCDGDGECVNFPGGYKCFCHDGFVMDENNSNKCIQFCNTTTCNADCVKDQKCKCPTGYILDQNEDGENICTDINECDNCVGSCINTPGSYICTCHEGYTLHNAVCIPLTEAPFYTPPPTSRPEDIYSLRPTIMWGICSGILSMLTVLIAMMCHRMRRHYIYHHDLDYNKDVVLKKIMMEPQWQI